MSPWRLQRREQLLARKFSEREGIAAQFSHEALTSRRVLGCKFPQGQGCPEASMSEKLKLELSEQENNSAFLSVGQGGYALPVL